MSMRVNGRGKESYACPTCENKAPKELKLAMARKRNTNGQTRGLEKFEVPKAERVKTQELAKFIPKVPDSPVKRELARVDSPKPRAKVFCEGVGSMGGSRNSKVMRELTKKLGPNPKILADDGFQVLAEASA